MTADIKAGLYERYPHVESLLDEWTELSDGAVLKVELAGVGDTRYEDSDDFSVWEMPLIRYIAKRENGFGSIAIPVFPARRFVQWMVEVPVDSDIHEVKDLEGKRIVQNYVGATDSVWARGLFEETYKVDLSGVTWFTRMTEFVPGHEAPEGTVCLEGAKRDDLLLDGVVDAALTSGHGNPIRPGLRSLFAVPEVEAAEWYKSWKIFPMLHVVVVRESALAEHASLAHDLYQAFDDAKTNALVKWNYGASLPQQSRALALWSGFPGSASGGASRSFLGRDPLPYGLELQANHDALERVIRYGVEQGALQRSHELDELFVSVDRYAL